MHQLHGLITLGQNELRGGARPTLSWSDDADVVAGSNQPVRANRKPETDAGVAPHPENSAGMVRSRSTTALSHAQ